MEQEEYYNRSILRALSIIESYAAENRPLGIGEVSRSINLSKSTVHRIVLTLESRGWLRRLPDSDKYVLGLKVATLSTAAYDGIKSRKEIRQYLGSLSEIVDETVVLSIWNDNDVVCIDKIETAQPVSITSKIGQRFPFHAGASGFATLLTMPDEMVKKLLAQKQLEMFTDKTLTDTTQLYKKYLEAKKVGYVKSTGERDAGVTSIATGIYFPYEQIYASLAVVLPESRASESKVEEITKQLLLTTKRISVHLDFSVVMN